jgi:hypothetical protein
MGELAGLSSLCLRTRTGARCDETDLHLNHTLFFRQWGYLGWLTTTKAEFKTLQITMQWDPSFLRGPAIGPDFILESLGTQLKFTFVPGQQMPQLQGK